MEDELKIRERFGRRLRDLRKARGMAQDKLADVLELDRTYVSGIERGKRNVSLVNLALIANRLDMSLSEMFENL